MKSKIGWSTTSRDASESNADTKTYTCNKRVIKKGKMVTVLQNNKGTMSSIQAKNEHNFYT